VFFKIIGVIPARLKSRRLPEKPLINLCGKPLIQWVYEQSKKALDNIIIATDDERIRSVAEGFGANVVMTSNKHQSGTDRVREAVSDIDVTYVVNIQGDQPLIPPSMINELVDCLINSEVPMVTLKKEITRDEVENPNIVKVVCDRNDLALYFSRSVIPYSGVCHKHIGIYGYRKDFLFKFAQLPQGILEKKEGLEQLRALEHGYKIKVKTTEYDSFSVDTEEDFLLVKKLMNKK